MGTMLEFITRMGYHLRWIKMSKKLAKFRPKSPRVLSCGEDNGKVV